MTPALSLLGLGFLLGVRHATDADHVVAVSTIVARERSIWASSLSGALWGLGHTATVFVVGGIIVLFNLVIPPQVGIAMELGVAAMLIALGLANVVGSFAGHRGGAHARTHFLPAAPASGRSERRAPQRAILRPLIVGVVHGLAGSAAVSILVLSTIHSATWGLLYLAIFGLGTVAGMVLLTTAIGVPLAYTSRRFARLNALLAAATGLTSIGLGAGLACELISGHGVLSIPQ
jgi:sulfite exporter TauE/SafE